MLKSYYALWCHNLQTSYLCNLITVLTKNRSYNKNKSTTKEFSHIYRFSVNLSNVDTTYIKICKDLFNRSFKNSDGRITRALVNKVVGSTPPKDARGKKRAVNKVSNKKRNEVIHFIKIISYIYITLFLTQKLK